MTREKWNRRHIGRLLNARKPIPRVLVNLRGAWMPNWSKLGYQPHPDPAMEVMVPYELAEVLGLEYALKVTGLTSLGIPPAIIDPDLPMTATRAQFGMLLPSPEEVFRTCLRIYFDGESSNPIQGEVVPNEN